jgi:hypothetical protein
VGRRLTWHRPISHPEIAMTQCSHEETKGKKIIRCDKQTLPGSATCHKHGGRAVVVATRAIQLQTTDDGGNTWTVADHNTTRTWLQGLVDQAQGANVEALVAAMEDGTANGRTKTTPTGAGNLYHASQGSAGKSGALSVFWYESAQARVTPAAIGAHTDTGYTLSTTFSNWTYGASLTYKRMKAGL